MKRKHWDERQEQAAARTGMISFYVMFAVCAVVILAELLWKGDLELVSGETIVFLAGGITCIAGSLKNGMWTKGDKPVPVWQNLLGSVICSGIFSVLYAFMLRGKAGADTDISRVVVLFFAGITILCFLCLSLMSKTAQRKREKEEKKYSE